MIIFTDDQGYGDVGAYGAEGFRTPNLDRMAAQGVRLTDFYVAAPVCTPSRAALLTGSYPKRLGLAHRVVFPFSDHGLSPDEATIAEVLKPAGYRSAIIGKWHLGHRPPFMPLRQGFDVFFGIPYSNDMNRYFYKARQYQSPPLPFYDQERMIEEDPDQRFLTKRLTEAAAAFIEETAPTPFFLYLAHPMPHRPIHASPAFEGRSAIGSYGDVIEEIDWSVGQIQETLARTGLQEKTLVIFTSDNGPWRKPSSGGLRGRKNTTWEGGMRVPFLATWPTTLPEGRVIREMVTALDILPTLAGLAKARIPDDRTLDGSDVWPLLTGTPQPALQGRPFYFYRDNRLQAVRAGRWKLHLYRPEWDGTQSAPLLFDLEVDRSEEKNVAAANPEIVRRLLKLAADAREELGDAATGSPGDNVRQRGEWHKQVEENAAQ